MKRKKEYLVLSTQDTTIPLYGKATSFPKKYSSEKSYIKPGFVDWILILFFRTCRRAGRESNTAVGKTHRYLHRLWDYTEKRSNLFQGRRISLLPEISDC